MHIFVLLYTMAVIVLMRGQFEEGDADHPRRLRALVDAPEPAETCPDIVTGYTGEYVNAVLIRNADPLQVGEIVGEVSCYLNEGETSKFNYMIIRFGGNDCYSVGSALAALIRQKIERLCIPDQVMEQLYSEPLVMDSDEDEGSRGPLVFTERTIRNQIAILPIAADAGEESHKLTCLELA